MRGLFLFAVLIGLPTWGNAQPCSAVETDSARLACYDAVGECTRIRNPAERLKCFDGAASGSVAPDGAARKPAMQESPQRVVAEPVPARVPAAATPAKSTTPAPRDDFGVKRERPSEIRTRIVGEFDGWNGSQRFEMANGQIWEHRKSTRRSYPSVMNPEVVIRKNLFGFYMMDVEGAGATLPVKRIK